MQTKLKYLHVCTFAACLHAYIPILTLSTWFRGNGGRWGTATTHDLNHSMKTDQAGSSRLVKEHKSNNHTSVLVSKLSFVDIIRPHPSRRQLGHIITSPMTSEGAGPVSQQISGPSVSRSGCGPGAGSARQQAGRIRAAGGGSGTGGDGRPDGAAKRRTERDRAD